MCYDNKENEYTARCRETMAAVRKGKKERKLMAKELPKRSEVPMEHTWALEDMYASVSEWEDEIAAIRVLTKEMESARERMTANGSNLLAMLECYARCAEKLMLAYDYANRASDADTKNMENQANAQKIMSIYVECSSRLAFLDPMILELGEEKLNSFYEEEPGLIAYRLHIEEVKRRKAHRLSAEMEELLASAGEMQQSPDMIFNIMNNSDLQFPVIADEKGEEVRITQGRYTTLLTSGDRRVRKDTFTGFYSVYEQFKNTLAATYSSQVKQLQFDAKARKYSSTLEAALDVTNVPVLVYDNLLETVNANLDKMHRYVSLRKKWLGVEELHMYDISTPMVAGVDRKISYEEAKDTVLKALAPLGERYVGLVKEGYDSRWIDVYENEGKRSGAYSAGVYGVHPYVLLNHDDTLNDMFTLAHEMGHAIHSYLSNEEQPYLYSEYKIFVAEVASTCNEVLLIEYLLQNTMEEGISMDKKERAYLLNRFLDSYKGTVYRQTMFAEYEKITNEMAEQGESLTAEVLSKVYYDLNCKYYGPDMVSDPQIALEWSRIPHFYLNFYVYQYATGFSAAVAIARRILKEGEAAVADYMKFLSGGCTKPPVELLKIAGVDMSKKESIQEALDVFGELLDEMEALTEECL